MEELRADDVRVLGAYVLLAALTPAGGEPRLLARRPAGEGLTEITLVRGDVRATAAALRAAEGPGFPELLEDGTAARPPWLAWRYVPALTLAEAGALMYGGLPRATVRALGGRIAVPLARLHARGTAHGALTSDAVLVGPDGPRLTRPRRTGGPPDDIAALGTLLTRAGAGRAPDDPLLRRCSHEDPEQRPTAEELAAELGEDRYELPPRLVGALARQADRALALESATDTPPPAPTARTARRTLLTAAGAGLLLGAGSVAGWVAGRGGSEALTSPAGTARRMTARPTALPSGAVPTARWRYDARSPLLNQDGALVHAGDKAVFVVEYPQVTALDLAEGRPLWRRGDLEPHETPVPGAAGTLILARPDRLLAVSTDDGRQLWAKDLTSSGLSFSDSMGYDTGLDRLYYGAVGEGTAAPTYVVAFDTRTRTERWRARIPATKAGEFVSLYETDRIRVLYAADGALNLVDVDRRTGRVGSPFRHTWRFPPGTDVGASALSGMIYNFGDGRVRAAPLRENRVRWELDLNSEGGAGGRGPGVLTSPLTARVPRLGTVAFLTDDNRRVYAVDAARGRELWRRALLPDPPYGEQAAPDLSLTKSARTLLASGHGAGVVALDARTGAVRWTFQSNQSAASVYTATAAGDTALIANGSALFAFPAG